MKMKLEQKSFCFLKVVIPVLLIFTACSKSEQSEALSEHQVKRQSIDYYTCGMHPTVKVSVQEYAQGKTNCPICNMKLIPVYSAESKQEGNGYYGCGMQGADHVFLIQEIKVMKNCPVCGMPLKKLSQEEADKLKGVVSRVMIKGEQARLAGVKAESVKKLHLYKEIRTVGTVAYDPQLEIAQEEFISSLNALDKIEAGDILEIKQRARELVESGKKKLKLLGLSQQQIDEFVQERKVQSSLILPGKKMWVYGDIYEYEMEWLKKGSSVKVTAESVPGVEFTGRIISINPVLDPKTRSIRFRAEVENSDLKLQPEMYVDIVIQSVYLGLEGEVNVLAIPKSAVLNTGVRQIVWVDKQNGGYEGRLVEIGPEAVASVDGKEAKFYPVLKGVREGEFVVFEANFLIDSQSQISGVAASAYGGVLAPDDKKNAPVHQH